METTHGTITTHLACVALCCARCRVLQPFGALKRVTAGHYICVDALGCWERQRENQRAS